MLKLLLAPVMLLTLLLETIDDSSPKGKIKLNELDPITVEKLEELRIQCCCPGDKCDLEDDPDMPGDPTQ